MCELSTSQTHCKVLRCESALENDYFFHLSLAISEQRDWESIFVLSFGAVSSVRLHKNSFSRLAILSIILVCFRRFFCFWDFLVASVFFLFFFFNFEFPNADFHKKFTKKKNVHLLFTHSLSALSTKSSDTCIVATGRGVVAMLVARLVTTARGATTWAAVAIYVAPGTSGCWGVDTGHLLTVWDLQRLVVWFISVQANLWRHNTSTYTHFFFWLKSTHKMAELRYQPTSWRNIEIKGLLALCEDTRWQQVWSPLAVNSKSLVLLLQMCDQRILVWSAEPAVWRTMFTPCVGVPTRCAFSTLNNANKEFGPKGEEKKVNEHKQGAVET